LTHQGIPSVYIEGLECKGQTAYNKLKWIALRSTASAKYIFSHYIVYWYKILIKVRSLNHMPIKPQLRHHHS